MPPATTYRLVRLDSGWPCGELTTDSKILGQVAHLDQILLRKIELVAYTTLHKRCDELVTKPAKIDAPEIVKLRKQIKILLFQLSQSSLAGTSDATRLAHLSRSLYSFYQLAQDRCDKLKNISSHNSNQMLPADRNTVHDAVAGDET